MRFAVPFLVFCLLATQCVALGIAPARHETEHGGVVVYKVYNTEKKAFTAKIRMNGSLAEYAAPQTDALVFAPDEMSKTFSVAVDAPQTALAADIVVSDGKKEVRARLTTPFGPGLITGSAVREPETGSVLALVLVGANVAYFVYGRRRPETPQELLSYLQKIDDERFSLHLKRNDFVEWMHNHPELAFRLYDLRDRQDVIGAVRQHTAPREKDEETLRQEMLELRRELETFDFRGFERTQ